MAGASHHFTESRSREEPRFVVLHHHVGPQLNRTSQSHFDWMFQVDRTLRTWATPDVGSLDHDFAVDAQSLANHRLKYLEHEGEVAGDRGYVQRVISGTFELCEDASGCFSAQLKWEDADEVEHRATLSIYRSCSEEPSDSESKPPWRLRFVPCG